MGYGYKVDLTWLFLAMVRAAGLQAWPVKVSARDDHFFDSKMMEAGDLDDGIVLVQLEGKDHYFDPGAKFTPFGLLPWGETATSGRLLDKDGGRFVETPMPDSSSSRIERKAVLHLAESGELGGTLTVTYSGLEARRKRLQNLDEDSAGRKKALEDEVRDWVPATIQVELKNEPDWTSSAETLTADYALTIPEWGVPMARRFLVPAGLFCKGEQDLFKTDQRTYSIYFAFPFQNSDDITITMPPGMAVANLVVPKRYDGKFSQYELNAQSEGPALHITRNLVLQGGMISPQYYRAVRNYFQAVRASDEQQIILQNPANAASN